jgi:hypothetical protein
MAGGHKASVTMRIQALRQSLFTGQFVHIYHSNKTKSHNVEQQNDKHGCDLENQLQASAEHKLTLTRSTPARRRVNVTGTNIRSNIHSKVGGPFQILTV